MGLLLLLSGVRFSVRRPIPSVVLCLALKLLRGRLEPAGGALLGLDEAAVSAIVEGRLGPTSIDSLVRCLHALGKDVRILVFDIMAGAQPAPRIGGQATGGQRGMGGRPGWEQAGARPGIDAWSYQRDAFSQRRQLGDTGWTTLAEHRWIALGEDRWITFGEHAWYAIHRGLIFTPTPVGNSGARCQIWLSDAVSVLQFTRIGLRQRGRTAWDNSSKAHWRRRGRIRFRASGPPVTGPIPL